MPSESALSTLTTKPHSVDVVGKEQESDDPLPALPNAEFARLLRRVDGVTASLNRFSWLQSLLLKARDMKP